MPTAYDFAAMIALGAVRVRVRSFRNETNRDMNIAAVIGPLVAQARAKTGQLSHEVLAGPVTAKSHGTPRDR